MIKEKSKTWARISAQLGVIFSKLPFPPNYYTWLTIPVAFAGLMAIISAKIWLGVILFTISGVLDVIDGALARCINRSTYRGAFLDGSLDRFIDFMLIFSYFWLPIHTLMLPLGQWICAAIFFAIMPSFEVAYANHRRAVDDPEEKIIWRILNRGEMYLLMLLIPVLSIYNPIWSGYLLIGLVMLSLITTLQTLFTTLFLASSTD
jgi:archaetidylinositol phosphate synthase